MPLSYCPLCPRRLIGFSIPYHHVCAHNELWLGVPLVVGDIVMGLEPDPLLSFGQKPIAARLPLAKLHHCQQNIHTALYHNLWCENDMKCEKCDKSIIDSQGRQESKHLPTEWSCQSHDRANIIKISRWLLLTLGMPHSYTVQLTLTLDTNALMSATT